MPVSARRSVVLPWSMWPAVPTTTLGTGARAQPRRPRALPARLQRRGERLVVRGFDRPQVRARPPVLDPPDDRRRPARSRASSRSRRRALDRHRPRRQRLAGQRPAADRRSDLGDARPQHPRGDRGRLAHPARPTGVASCRHTGISRVATPARYSASVAATAARITLSGRIARASGSLPQLRDEVRAPDDEPGLRPADELVAAERHEVGAVGESLARASARGRARTPPCPAAHPSRGRPRGSRRAHAPRPRARAGRAPP